MTVRNGKNSQRRVWPGRNAYSDLLNRLDEMISENQWSTIVSEFPMGRLKDDFWNLTAVLWKVGFAYSQLKDYDRTLELYNRCLELEPQLANRHYAVGFVYYSRALDRKTPDDFRTAIEYFEKALELRPDYMVCNYRIGKAYICLSKPRKAQPYLTRAITYYEGLPKDSHERKALLKSYVKSLFQRGKSNQMIREYEQSIQDFSHAWERDKQEWIKPVFYPYNIGVSYLKMKEYAIAIDYFQRAKEMDSRLEFVLDKLGEAHMYAGDYDQADSYFRQAIAIKPRTYIFVHRGILHFFSGDLQGAYRDLYGALKRDQKGKHKIYLLLGRVAVEEGAFEKAEDFFRSAIEWKQGTYGADYLEAHVELAHLYSMMGLTDKASYEWDIVEALDPFIDIHALKKNRLKIEDVA